jgi:hypothetical protein
VSSKDQKKEGFSVAAQQRLLREYTIQHGIIVAEDL